VRVYTHCLLVSPEVLARFGNNPFALFKAAMAGGLLNVIDPLPTRLETATLLGGAAPVDQNLLLQLASHPGPAAMAVLLQAARDAACLAVVGQPSPERLMAGLISCLPPSCRCEFSFSTGLKFSPRRPFRLIAVPDDLPQQRWLAHQHNVTVLDLSGRTPLPALPLDGWAQFIQRVLGTGHAAFLAGQIAKRPVDLASTDLSALGLQLLEELEASNFCEHPGGSPTISPLPGRFVAPGEEPRVKGLGEEQGAQDTSEVQDSGCGIQDSEIADQHSAFRIPHSTEDADEKGIQHAHAAHRRFNKTAAGPSEGESSGPLKPSAGRPPMTQSIMVPSAILDPDSVEVLEKLERLDDLVFDAIQGQANSLDQLQTYWPAVKAELGDTLLAESREQYLRYALTIWEDCTAQDGLRSPDRAIHALDVLCLLFDEF
jgi:hypothetical protein